MEVRVEGLPRVQRALEALARAVDDPADGMDRVADEMARDVSQAAPKRTGRLAGSARGGTTRARAFVDVTAPYAGAINYGWPGRNIAPSGFMQQASDRAEDRAVELLDNYVDQQITKKGLS